MSVSNLCGKLCGPLFSDGVMDFQHEGIWGVYRRHLVGGTGLVAMGLNMCIRSSSVCGQPRDANFAVISEWHIHFTSDL